MTEKREQVERLALFFQLNPPLRVGEILLRNVKSSLRSGEIAAAVGGLISYFAYGKIFHKRRMILISPCVSTISLYLQCYSIYGMIIYRNEVSICLTWFCAKQEKEKTA